MFRLFEFEKSLDALLTTNSDKDLYGHTDYITTVAVNKTGNLLISGSRDNTIKIWNIKSRKVIHTLHDHERIAAIKYHSYVRSLDFNPKNNQFVSAANINKKGVLVWKLDDSDSKYKATDMSERYENWHDHHSKPTCVAFSPDGIAIVKGTEDGLVKIHKGKWELCSDPDNKTFVLDFNKNPTTIKASHYIWITAVAFSPNGDRIASASVDGDVKIWEVETGKLLHVLRGEGGVNSVEFSSDGTQIVCAVGNTHIKGGMVVAHSNCEVRIWDIPTQRIVQRLKDGDGVAGAITSAKFNHDENIPLVISGGIDEKVRIWHATTGKLLQTLDAKAAVMSIAYNHKTKRIFAGLDDNSIKIYHERSEIKKKRTSSTRRAQSAEPAKRHSSTRSARSTRRVKSAEPAKNHSSRSKNTHIGIQFPVMVDKSPARKTPSGKTPTKTDKPTQNDSDGSQN